MKAVFFLLLVILNVGSTELVDDISDAEFQQTVELLLEDHARVVGEYNNATQAFSHALKAMLEEANRDPFQGHSQGKILIAVVLTVIWLLADALMVLDLWEHLLRVACMVDGDKGPPGYWETAIFVLLACAHFFSGLPIVLPWVVVIITSRLARWRWQRAEQEPVSDESSEEEPESSFVFIDSES